MRVIKYLRELGHNVFAVTLTGLGERKHLLSKDVTLETHVLDVMNLVEFENLSQVVLVGPSFGGLVVSAVADRMPQRITDIYLFRRYRGRERPERPTNLAT